SLQNMRKRQMKRQRPDYTLLFTFKLTQILNSRNLSVRLQFRLIKHKKTDYWYEVICLNTLFLNNFFSIVMTTCFTNMMRFCKLSTIRALRYTRYMLFFLRTTFIFNFFRCSLLWYCHDVHLL